MDRRERIWLGVLIVVALGVNAITLTPLVPWQAWLLWSKPTPTETFAVDIADYRFHFPAQGIQAKAGDRIDADRGECDRCRYQTIQNTLALFINRFRERRNHHRIGDFEILQKIDDIRIKGEFRRIVDRGDIDVKRNLDNIIPVIDGYRNGHHAI